jgi:hypothetical protein
MNRRRHLCASVWPRKDLPNFFNSKHLKRAFDIFSLIKVRKCL